MKWVVNELTVAEYFKLTVAYKYVKNRRLKERLSLEIHVSAIALSLAPFEGMRTR